MATALTVANVFPAYDAIPNAVVKLSLIHPIPQALLNIPRRFGIRYIPAPRRTYGKWVLGLKEHQMDDVRRALEARVDSCFERLDDAVSELLELHEISVEAIVARVHHVAGDRGELGVGEAAGSD